MTALLELMMNLNTGDDDCQELAIRTVKKERLIGHNVVGDYFNFASSKFSMAKERRLQQRIKEGEEKIIEIDQTLPLKE